MSGPVQGGQDRLGRGCLGPRPVPEDPGHCSLHAHPGKLVCARGGEHGQGRVRDRESPPHWPVCCAPPQPLTPPRPLHLRLQLDSGVASGNWRPPPAPLPPGRRHPPPSRPARPRSGASLRASPEGDVCCGPSPLPRPWQALSFLCLGPLGSVGGPWGARSSAGEASHLLQSGTGP